MRMNRANAASEKVAFRALPNRNRRVSLRILMILPSLPFVTTARRNLSQNRYEFVISTSVLGNLCKTRDWENLPFFCANASASVCPLDRQGPDPPCRSPGQQEAVPTQRNRARREITFHISKSAAAKEDPACARQRFGLSFHLSASFVGSRFAPRAAGPADRRRGVPRSSAVRRCQVFR